MNKKICFFGLGSIGKRHLKNLRILEKERNDEYIIHAYRSSMRELDLEIKKLLDKEIYNIKSIENYDIVFITNPTSFHKETIIKMNNKTSSMFIEKPIITNVGEKTPELIFQNNRIYYTACPLRFSPVIKYLNRKLFDKKVYSARVICSSYLPEWRKDVDYRNVYSSKKELGGGVSLDLIHEIDYISYLFGFPIDIVNFKGKFSKLEINSDDLSLYILKYMDKMVEIHLDYFGRIPQRKIELFTDEDVIIADIINNKIEFKRKKATVCLARENIYLNEMNYFLDHIKNKERTYNEPDIALKNLALMEGVL